MPNYEINYLKEDGSLALKFEAHCADDTRAKILAHAMREHDFKKFEVWQAGALVYRRPRAEL
ncbi:MAG TPA: hypothetical protein VG819_14345 [Rhizomicrobium sp.]|jgi:hypothetical protein|nr:hypothetical protein [Rhizomicrobium sp.]